MNPAYDIVNTPEETRTKINFATVGRDDLARRWEKRLTSGGPRPSCPTNTSGFLKIDFREKRGLRFFIQQANGPLGVQSTQVLTAAY